MADSVLAACKKERTQKSNHFLDDDIVGHYDEPRELIIMNNEEKIDPSKVVFTSSDGSVGIVSASGMFTPKRIDNAVINVKIDNSSQDIVAIVEPYSRLCMEPYFAHSADKSTVQSYEVRELINDTGNTLIYKGENSKIRQVLYVFYPSSNKLISAALLLQNSKAVIEESAKFFAERYSPVGSKDGICIFTDHKKVMIGLTYDNQFGFLAVYLKYDAASIAAFLTTNPRQLFIKQLSMLRDDKASVL
ncbi:MAG: hypothetical protein ACOH2A_13610 [Sphingobacteriaceae bacterium]